MGSSSLSLKQAYTLLFLFLSPIINVTASNPEAGRKCLGICCSNGQDISDDEVAANEEAVQDGPTSDKSAGLGIEFEAGSVLFYSETCSTPDTNKLKAKVVANRRGTNWNLTADTTPAEAGYLTAEYILDGTTIRLGSGDAGTAAAAVGKDITIWDPSAASNPNTIDIEDDTCKDWKILQPETGGSAGGISWGVQATAPLPLEALQDLLSKAAGSQASPLLPSINPSRNIILTTKDFFQSAPNGIDSGTVKNDVLGFFTLVLSYAKGAKTFDEDASPKDIISIMPRTDFSTIFKQVSAAVPGDLYELIKVLGCYKPKGNTVEIDTDYCGGTPDAPAPNTKMDGQTFSVSSAGKSDSVSVQDWIRSIAHGDSPDKLTVVDQTVDSQVGGLGDALENVLDTTRAVPLFEFRRLRSAKAEDMQTNVEGIENELINYHKAHANIPRFIKKRGNSKMMHIKRQGPTSGCPMSTTAAATATTTDPSTSTITPPPSTPSCYLQNEDPDQGIIQQGCICGSLTLPLLTVPDATIVSQSCSYTTLPSSSVANPISIETEYWTRNCAACTLTGGIADTPTCTSVAGCTPTSDPIPTPTFVVNLSNNTVPIGDTDNADNGADLRKSVYSKLQALCPDNGKSCDSTKNAEIDNILNVVDGREETENLIFTIQDSNYENTVVRDKMLAAAVATWEQAARKSCKEVRYVISGGPDPSGCGERPNKRDIPTWAKLTHVEKRVPFCNGCGPQRFCHYTATMCAGPNHINPILADSKGNPYGNHMNIELSRKLSGTSEVNEFLCDLIIDGLTALAVAVAPELLEAEIAGEIEFEALCEELVSEINPRGLDRNKTVVPA